MTGAQSTGAVDLKSRIQGFGNGPDPPPVEDTIWGALFGVSPETEETVTDSLTSWYEDTVKGFEDMLNDISEEMMGEPLNTSTGEPASNNRATPSQQQKAKDRSASGQPQGYSADGSSNPDESRAADRPREIDVPGRYRIIGKETFLTDSVPLGGKILFKLQQGEEIMIAEVVHRQQDGRVRGRSENPAGWLSLLNMQTGYRWAERLQSKGSAAQEAGEQRRESNAQDSSEAKNKHRETLTKELAVQAKEPMLLDLDEPEQSGNFQSLRSCVVQGVESAADHGLCVESAEEDDELKEGDLVVRKGKEAIIICIERSLNPPAYVVRLTEDGREIGSEQHLLRKVKPSSTSAPKKRAVVDKMSPKKHCSTSQSSQALPEAATGDCVKSSSAAAEVDLLDMSDAPVQLQQPQQSPQQELLCAAQDEPSAEQKLKERIEELQALKKDAASREDFLEAQHFKSEIETLQAEVGRIQGRAHAEAQAREQATQAEAREQAKELARAAPASPVKEQTPPASPVKEQIPVTPVKEKKAPASPVKEAFGGPVPFLLPPPPSPVPRDTLGQRQTGNLLPSLHEPATASPAVASSSSWVASSVVVPPAAVEPWAAFEEPVASELPAAQPDPMTAFAAKAQQRSHRSSSSDYPGAALFAAPAAQPDPMAAFAAPSAAPSTVLEPWGVLPEAECALPAMSHSAAAAVSGSSAPSSLPRGVSEFDPLGDEGAEEEEDTVSDLAPSTAWRGCAVPRGISLFDPMSDKN